MTNLKKLIAELKAEGRIVDARRTWHPGIIAGSQNTPPASGGAAPVARVWDGRGLTKRADKVH
jgi:hypothetical protein